MNNLIEFLRMLLSYLSAFAVYVVVAGVAVFIGIRWRKSKNAKAEPQKAAVSGQEKEE